MNSQKPQSEKWEESFKNYIKQKPEIGPLKTKAPQKREKQEKTTSRKYEYADTDETNLCKHYF